MLFLGHKSQMPAPIDSIDSTNIEHKFIDCKVI